MIRFWILAAATVAAAPLAAQDHSAHGKQTAPEVDHCAMGHMPADQCPPKTEGKPPADADHAAMGHSGSGEKAAPPMDHAAMGHGAQPAGAVDKTAQGAAPETAVPARALAGPRHAADSIWGTDAMAPSRRQLARENGDMKTGMVLIERLEARFAADGGENGYVWDAQGWYGGDINRLVIKTEGEGEFGGEVEGAEIQALYSRAIGPFFDLQAGVRFDPAPDTRTHLVVGVQGLAPYMFHVDGALFLSDRGDLTARIEGEYDQKITRQIILQPRIEIEFAAQDIPERATGAGITKIEPGLRLRYELQPEFAPYVGIEYEAKIGETADLARLAGEDPDGVKFVIGVRAWF
ncbi:copper resistance protein B [Pontixanthobacter aestiaquae]|uniref:Copper resistance protein B n=1 Tax=Pontixanthobacter aestiaquae TaxID=1509367 RepID=A0A844Z733_9SPHN|nr:copper resistance protein B [Pontixanthobacter aestiaquae]MDN3646326.1 copper resistance protein B [Pontixanthobacter aestiaquae]MXO82683.1 copper resistance protein B [Pontixanthobacter aestiaquae]